MKYLALDVGERRVGVALSETGMLASPYTTIHRSAKVDDFARVARLIRELEIGMLVVGHPLDDDGTAGAQARRIERYTESLVQALRDDGLDLPVVLWDERMSTMRAQDAMISAGRGARHRRGQIDAAAAAVILQDYLDGHQSPLEAHND